MNYFRYLPPSKQSVPWGLSVTAAGFTRIAPNTPYPPRGHPSDHDFRWDQGRVLARFQLVFILEGSGAFDARSFKSCPVERGTVFLLFPHEWHRYAPNRSTGWVESWLELEGETVDRLIHTGVFSARDPIIAMRQRAKLERALEQVHAAVRSGPGMFDPEVSALAYSILARLQAARKRALGPAPRIEQLIAQAQVQLAEGERSATALPALARHLGIGYSYFRREFKRRVGVSPRHYANQLRLERARRLLGSTSQTVEAIADELGFASAFHLSSAFKRVFGLAPAHWRREHAAR